MSLIDWNYTRTDEHGVEHHYPRLFGWHCSIHQRVCSPFKPVTGDDILRLAAKDSAVDDDTFVVLRQAAKDSAVDDDTFVVLRQAVEGREIGGAS